MGGCWVCNPFCGKCKPPIIRKQCPECGRFYFPEMSPEIKCKKCGAELPEYIPSPPVWCAFIAQMCAKPCERYTLTSDDGIYKPCAFHTLPQANTQPNAADIKKNHE